MNKFRIFVASSSKGKPIAEALCLELELLNNENGQQQETEWEVIRWWDQRYTLQTYGLTIIDGLIKECKVADLAITLLTADDLTLKRDEEILLEPRDNCIFEAGLFMGGLGLDPTRSVILTSLAQSALPSDLQGIQYIPFTPSDENNGKKSLKKMMQPIAAQLVNHAIKIRKLPPKRPTLRVLTPEALIDRERPINDGGDLYTDNHNQSIVINTTQPAESKLKLAHQVIKNMAAGVKYIYFFRVNPQRAEIVAGLVQSLVIAKSQTEDTELNNQQRSDFIKNNSDKIISNLREIQDSLFIHFMPDDRAPLLFCVHNAGDDKKAKCYLRNVEDDTFMEWGLKDKAFYVAGDIRRHQKQEGDEAIFYSTDLFDLYDNNEGKEFREKLQSHLTKMFKNLSNDQTKELIKLCFLESAEQLE